MNMKSRLKALEVRRTDAPAMVLLIASGEGAPRACVQKATGTEWIAAAQGEGEDDFRERLAAMHRPAPVVRLDADCVLL
ncbi:MAG: hypothetical protein KGN33_17300 [Paracoccaceae bacterium]|nr:hypothetical protein [Paracoccaceae bacterium]